MGSETISENLYWYKDKKYTLLPVKIVDKEAIVIVSPEFVEMIDSL
ncbi:MAG: hypothetical protein ACTSUC_01780 [Promethearchaeota archaeon]